MKNYLFFIISSKNHIHVYTVLNQIIVIEIKNICLYILDDMDNIVSGRCSVSQIIKHQEDVFFLNINIISNWQLQMTKYTIETIQQDKSSNFLLKVMICQENGIFDSNLLISLVHNDRCKEKNISNSVKLLIKFNYLRAN